MPLDPAAIDPNLEEILLHALASLEVENAAAFRILKAQISQGFFEVRLTNRPLQDLADEILKTVTETEAGSDAS